MVTASTDKQNGDCHSALLQRDVERMDSIREIQEMSEQLTSAMNVRLEAFEERLATLEHSVLPVYHETSNLQRRKQNIEKTLEQLDCAISYYNVSRELDPIIRSGLSGKSTESYLAAMDRLKDALTFFKVNNSQSVELENIMLLINIGMDMLRKEFESLVSKHSKHTKPICVLNMIDTAPTDTVVSADVLGDSSAADQFDIPASVMDNMIVIAHWLSQHHAAQSHSPHTAHFMHTYVRVRTSILIRTLQELQKHQRGRSNGSNYGTVDQQSPITSQTGRATARGATSDSGDALRRSRRFKSRIERTATKIWSRAQQRWTGAAGGTVGTPSSLKSEAGEDYIDECDVCLSETAVSALLALFGAELTQLTRLCTTPPHQLRQLFQSLIEEPLALVVKDIENLAQRGRRCVSRQLFTPVLCLFPLLSHLMAVRPQFERLLTGCDASVRNRISGTIDVVHQTCGRCLDGFIEWVSSDMDKHVPPDCTVHQRTSNVLMYCHQLLEYADTVGWILCQHADYSSVVTVATHSDKYGALLGRFISGALDALARSLTLVSGHYSDVSMRAIFLLNNHHYILQSSEQLQLLPLMQLLDPPAAAAAAGSAHTKLTDLVNEQRLAYTQSWSRVVQCLTLAEEIPTLRLEIDRLSDSERKLLKDRFSLFCREMEEMTRVLRQLSVPDIELRETLKRTNKEHILPKYSKFYDRYSGVNFSKQRDKYIRYTPAQVSMMVDSFFDITA